MASAALSPMTYLYIDQGSRLSKTRQPRMENFNPRTTEANEAAEIIPASETYV